MLVTDFDFDLPEELIAQCAAARGESRLLVLHRTSGGIEHRVVADVIQYLHPGDLLVVNDTRVFAARLLGRRVSAFSQSASARPRRSRGGGGQSGGAVECLLLKPAGEPDVWEALVHPGQKLKPGAIVRFEGSGGALTGRILERRFFGRRTIQLQLERGASIESVIDAIGHIPLPPYIHRADTADDRERYQTVYASARGSIAAPTAGLHFTAAMLDALDRAGVERVAITLHVGYGTFKPVRTEEVEQHVVDPERYEISGAAAAALNNALDQRRRIIAVGTTTTRALEDAARRGNGRVQAGEGEATTFIYPGFDFKVICGLVTNFHLPRSSLLMLVAAFAGREQVLAAYRAAVEQRYRFYSYGDAMLIL